MYEMYKIARNKSWEVLIKCNITALPVNLKAILNMYGLVLNVFTNKGNEEAFIENNIIYINKNLDKARARFTIAHELGHILLKHSNLHHATHDFESDVNLEEFQANIFDRGLLMPAIVLKEINTIEPEDIMTVCNVSRKAAEYRSERLKELLKRNKFNTHPKEKEVLSLFQNFIKYNKNPLF